MFWSIELNDLWSKKICRPKMIVWSGATFTLRWSCPLCCRLLYHHVNHVKASLCCSISSIKIFTACEAPRQRRGRACPPACRPSSTRRTTLRSSTDTSSKRSGQHHHHIHHHHRHHDQNGGAASQEDQHDHTYLSPTISIFCSATVTSLQAKVEGLATTNALMKVTLMMTVDNMLVFVVWPWNWP